MSNYHVMKSSASGSTISAILHIPVPNELNAAGISLSDCLKEDEAYNKTSMLPWIATPDQLDLDNGLLYEVRHTVYTHPDISQAVNIEKIKTAYAEHLPVMQEQIRKMYANWHIGGDVD